MNKKAQLNQTVQCWKQRFAKEPRNKRKYFVWALLPQFIEWKCIPTPLAGERLPTLRSLFHTGSQLIV